ncbi:MAG: TPM domain-containing protein [Clostridia bacterium]|nr:TPM domain-containing protein [Clostridia bacterium]
MKRLICLITVLGLMALCGAFADTAPVIQDDADLLTAEEEASLREVMNPICEYGTPVFWTTTQSGDYRSKAENYYYRMLGNSSGVLFVIDMNSRQLLLKEDGAISKIVTSGEADTITDNVFRLARSGKYAACAEETFREVYRLLRGEQIARPMKLVSNILLALVLALLIVYLFISHRYENRYKIGKRSALPVTAASAAAFTASLTAGRAIMTRQRRVNLNSSSGGGGRIGGGGGHSSGGGGGFSGGGGSHGF